MSDRVLNLFAPFILSGFFLSIALFIASPAIIVALLTMTFQEVSSETKCTMLNVEEKMDMQTKPHEIRQFINFDCNGTLVTKHTQHLSVGVLNNNESLYLQHIESGILFFRGENMRPETIIKKN